jgi:hypothetical protein
MLKGQSQVAATAKAQGTTFSSISQSYKVETLGWSPSCECGNEVVPCTVLDPFAGAGTTGLVADRLKRSAILIELNPEYAAMAAKRIEADAGMFAPKVTVEAELPAAPLFAEEGAK